MTTTEIIAARRAELEASLAFSVATRARRVETGRHEFATGELGHIEEWADPETGERGCVCHSWDAEGYEYGDEGGRPERESEARILAQLREIVAAESAQTSRGEALALLAVEEAARDAAVIAAHDACNALVVDPDNEDVQDAYNATQYAMAIARGRYELAEQLFLRECRGVQHGPATALGAAA